MWVTLDAVRDDWDKDRYEELLLDAIRQRRKTVFLCHSSDDKEQVRRLYRQLGMDGFACWFDEEDLLGGQDFDREINLAIESCQHVIVCLSTSSTNKVGYVQKELKKALDVADRQPEGAVFLIPVCLDPCVLPHRLKHLHAIKLFESTGYSKLLRTLRSPQTHQT